MPGEWSDRRKWWMDLLRSILSFTAIAVLTYAIVDGVQYRRDRERARLVEEGLTRREVLEQFRSSSLRYREAALDAFVDLYPLYRQAQLSTERDAKSDAMLRYESVAYDDYLLSMEGLRDNFSSCGELGVLLDDLKRVNDSRHEIYDQLFDLKVDGFITFEANPAAQRDAFDKGLEEFSRKRDEILKQLRTCIAASSDA